MPPSSVAKRILVTGGNKGIGLAICQRLLTEWSDTYVILTARNIQRGQQAVKDVVDSCGGGTKDRIEFLQLDTASDESVAVAAKALEKQEQPLYAIINNAGVSETVVSTSIARGLPNDIVSPAFRLSALLLRRSALTIH